MTPPPAAGVGTGAGVPEAGRDAPAARDGLGAAQARLVQLPGLPVAEHVAVFEDVHQLLAGVLDALDAADSAEAPGPGGAVPTAAGASGQPPRPGPPRPGPGGRR
jgi:hypothetical protein